MTSPVTPKIKMDRVFANNEKFQVLHLCWNIAEQQQKSERSRPKGPGDPAKEWWAPVEQPVGRGKQLFCSIWSNVMLF